MSVRSKRSKRQIRIGEGFEVLHGKQRGQVYHVSRVSRNGE